MKKKKNKYVPIKYKTMMKNKKLAEYSTQEEIPTDSEA